MEEEDEVGYCATECGMSEARYSSRVSLVYRELCLDELYLLFLDGIYASVNDAPLLLGGPPGPESAYVSRLDGYRCGVVE